MVDWLLAGKIAGIGFATVFIVLSVLSLVLWIVSLLLYKVFRRQKEEKTEENSAKA